MYNNTQSAVINNGHISDFFPMERGVRQGCPLSAYIFILTLEMLENKIRADTNVKGIIINNIDVKISLLADDVTCIFKNTNSLKNVLNILNIVHLCSGLKINIDKTKALYIGSLKRCDYYPHGLSWIKDNSGNIRNCLHQYNRGKL